jgi:hypothetical protein
MLLIVLPPPPSELLLMLEPSQWQQGIYSPCKIRYKTSQIIYHAEQLLDVFLARWFSNLSVGLNFLVVNLYAMFMYYNPQEPSRCSSKSALQQVYSQSIFFHPFQRQFQVGHVLLESNRLYHYIVNVCLHQNSEQIMED